MRHEHDKDNSIYDAPAPLVVSYQRNAATTATQNGTFFAFIFRLLIAVLAECVKTLYISRPTHFIYISIHLPCPRSIVAPQPTSAPKVSAINAAHTIYVAYAMMMVRVSIDLHSMCGNLDAADPFRFLARAPKVTVPIIPL